MKLPASTLADRVAALRAALTHPTTPPPFVAPPYQGPEPTFPPPSPPAGPVAIAADAVVAPTNPAAVMRWAYNGAVVGPKPQPLPRVEDRYEWHRCWDTGPHQDMALWHCIALKGPNGDTARVVAEVWSTSGGRAWTWSVPLKGMAGVKPALLGSWDKVGGKPTLAEAQAAAVRSAVWCGTLPTLPPKQ